MYNFFQKLKDYLRYREAVKKADKAHNETGERYYVMPNNTQSGKPQLIIMDRWNFRKLRQKHYIPKEAKVRDLVNECFYCTAYPNGDGYLDERGRKLKLKTYFSYCKAVRAQKKGSRK